MAGTSATTATWPVMYAMSRCEAAICYPPSVSCLVWLARLHAPRQDPCTTPPAGNRAPSSHKRSMHSSPHTGKDCIHETRRQCLLPSAACIDLCRN